MLTRPLTLSEGDDRGRGQITVTPPPALPLADEDDDESQTGVFSPPAPPWSSSSSSSPSSPPPPPPPPPSSSSSSSSSSSCAPSFPPPLPPPPCPLSLRPPVSPPCTPSHLPPVSPACVPPLVLPPATAAPPPAPRPCALSPHLLCAPLLLPPPPCASLPPPAPTPCTPSLPLPALVPPPPVPPPPCCSCSSLLPRLLSAHRLEMRRLLRGALASLGRRLDSLERRSRRKMRKKSRNRQRGRGGGGEEEEVGGAAGRSPGSTVFSPTPLCGPAHLPPVSTSSSLSSSSSDSEDSTTPPPSSSLSQSERRRRRRRSRGEEEEGEGRGRKRRRKNQRGCVPPENREEEEEEEENAGRFVGRMVVSFRGGAEEEEEEAPLTLYNFSHRKHRRREGARANQSEKTVSVFRRNGYRSPPPHNSSSFSSQHALHLLQSAQRHQTCSQSEALFSVSSGQWHFSDFTPPLPLSSNNSGFHLWLCSSSSSSSALSPASMLRLSAVAVETMSESVKGGASWSPLRSLKDWTAPPSLSSDHCYVRTSSASPTFSTRRHQKQRANHSSRSLHLTRRWPMALPPCSTNRLSAPLPTSQSATCSEFLSTNGERGKRVSQIRIRRASPREMQLTPMGLPKVKRLKKKEFSLEEIYTNKNYKSPSTNRSLETIFEEPREKDGALLRIGHQRRRRLLLFPDFTQPRKRKKPQVAGLPPVAMVPRKRAAARRHCHSSAGDDESDLDVMLVERLSALEDFLTRQGLDV